MSWYQMKKTVCWLACWATIPLAAGCVEPPQIEWICDEPPVIDLPDGAVQIVPKITGWDSPVLSSDGNRLAVQVEVYGDPVLPYEIFSLGVTEKDASGTWQPVAIVRQGIYRKYLGRMTQPVQPCFDHTGDFLYLTQIEFESFLSIPSVSTLRSWIERIPWRGGDAERVVEHADWDMKPTELLQHARLSPDGRWLTFYTRVHPRNQGCYLLDLKTNEHFRLSDQHDKHPTWDPNGRRIWFHHASGGKRHRFDFFASGVERAVIGYFDLTFENGQLIEWKRHLMDELDDRFIYHKHPTIVAGTDLLFFHGDLKPDGKKKLMVRKAGPGSEVFVVKPTCEGKKLKAAKHPCSSFEKADLVFIAKPKGEKTYSLLLALTDEAIEKIRRIVNGESQAHRVPHPLHQQGLGN